MALPVRRRMASGRRTRRAVRGAPLVSLARLCGLALMTIAAGAFAWLVDAPQFSVDASRLSVSGLQHTDPALVRALVEPWLADQPSIFLFEASELEAALSGLPAVATARVRVALPDQLSLEVAERQPVVVLDTPDGRFLVDAAGVFLRELAEQETPAGQLPSVQDRRVLDEPRLAGQAMEPHERDALLKLAALDAEMLGSRAGQLSLLIDADNGFVLSAAGLWQAFFGHYTPTLRPPDIIDRQVQCLRSLIAEQPEQTLERVYLSPAEDRCGTFEVRPSPTPSATPEEDE